MHVSRFPNFNYCYDISRPENERDVVEFEKLISRYGHEVFAHPDLKVVNVGWIDVRSVVRTTTLRQGGKVVAYEEGKNLTKIQDFNNVLTMLDPRLRRDTQIISQEHIIQGCFKGISSFSAICNRMKKYTDKYWEAQRASNGKNVWNAVRYMEDL